MARDRRLPAEQTLGRRTWLEWVGKTAVVGLGAELIATCCGSSGSAPPPTAITFNPGEPDSPVMDDWGERTVDRQDLPAILRGWRLRVDGMVEAPLSLSFADLVGRTRQDQVTDFHCVEGWTIQDVPWNGLALAALLAEAKPTASAGYVTFHTINGKYNESLRLPVAREPRTLLAYGIAGATLPLPHGFPLRLVVPRLLGYKSAKYVERLELTDRPIHGFWVQNGYDYEGEVPAGRLRPGKY